MSDTPRTDAIYPVELLDRGIKEHGRTWGWGIVSDFRDLARQLERELASVTKGSLELEEERDELDMELQDADRRANSLMRELAEANHRIRTLIEQRDGFRIQADHKWRLREEFEALLGTSDIETGVERVRDAQKGAARYEYVRKLNSRLYAKLITDCMMCDLNFDAEVDRRRNEK